MKDYFLVLTLEASYMSLAYIRDNIVLISSSNIFKILYFPYLVEKNHLEVGSSI